MQMLADIGLGVILFTTSIWDLGNSAYIDEFCYKSITVVDF